MSDPVLVTGAAGFAGSHFLDLLAAESLPAVAWHRPGGRRYDTPGSSQVRWMAVDLLDRSAVRGAIRELRPAAVMHCAGAAHVGGSWTNVESTFAANVRGTHHLLDALIREDVGARVVVTGSATVYRTSREALTEDDPLVPASPYGLSKLAQELVATEAARDGLHVTIARSFNHAGPRQDPSYSTSSFARQIAEIECGRRPPALVVGNLDTRRDLTDVRDTVRAYYALLRRGAAGRVYNVCSGQARSMTDVLEMIVARSRVPVTVRVDPALYRPADIPVVLGDPARIRGELGWVPSVPLERTIDALLDYWRAQCAYS